MMLRTLATLALVAPAFAWMPSSQHSGRVISVAATATAPAAVKVIKVQKVKPIGTETGGLCRSYIMNRIERSTKENFSQMVLCKEVEDYMVTRGKIAYPKLKKRIMNKAKAFGIEVKVDFAKKPWDGPPIWLKGQAAEAIKAAMAKKDVSAIEAAVAASSKLEGIAFVKVQLDSKGKPKKEQPTTPCSLLLVEAKAMVETLKKEEAAAVAAAAAAAAPPAEPASA